MYVRHKSEFNRMKISLNKYIRKIDNNSNYKFLKHYALIWFYYHVLHRNEVAVIESYKMSLIPIGNSTSLARNASA